MCIAAPFADIPTWAARSSEIVSRREIVSRAVALSPTLIYPFGAGVASLPSWKEEFCGKYLEVAQQCRRHVELSHLLRNHDYNHRFPVNAMTALLNPRLSQNRLCNRPYFFGAARSPFCAHAVSVRKPEDSGFLAFIYIDLPTGPYDTSPRTIVWTVRFLQHILLSAQRWLMIAAPLL